MSLYKLAHKMYEPFNFPNIFSDGFVQQRLKSTTCDT